MLLILPSLFWSFGSKWFFNLRLRCRIYNTGTWTGLKSIWYICLDKALEWPNQCHKPDVIVASDSEKYDVKYISCFLKFIGGKSHIPAVMVC